MKAEDHPRICRSCGGAAEVTVSSYPNYLVYKCTACGGYGVRIHWKDATKTELKAARKDRPTWPD